MATLDDITRFAKQGLVVLAHRGSRFRAPENTIAAFQLAFEEGADGVELDVRLSRDGEVFVFHDRTLGRTTNGSGEAARKTLHELKSLDAGSWKDPRFAGERIPTLREVFSVLSPVAILAIELKRDPRKRELVDRTVALVREFHAEKRVFLLSFDASILRYAKRVAPELVTALIYPDSSFKYFWASMYGYWRARADVAILGISYCNKETVSRFLRRGMRVICGNANTAEEVAGVRNLGIKLMITDHYEMVALIPSVTNTRKNASPEAFLCCSV